MSTGWNKDDAALADVLIINLLGNEYWLEQSDVDVSSALDYKPTGK